MGGRFVISLDFELHWGVRDQWSVDQYRSNLLGVREVVPRILELFEGCQIHATWATVGFLMAEDRDELLDHLPDVRGAYMDPRLDPYTELPTVGQNERDDPFHYAPSLVQLVAMAPDQEIATHTLSHFYVLDPGVSDDAFRADIKAALGLAASHHLAPTSIVFPRNQVSAPALRICQELGLTAFRGTERAWYQHPRRGTDPQIARVCRLVDAYVPLGTHHLQHAHEVSGVVNVPQTRFLRPCHGSFGRLDAVRLARIDAAMTAAAEAQKIFHLWWHPHNFGADPASNLAFLAKIIERYARLRDSFGFNSMTMCEVADEYRSATRASGLQASSPKPFGD